MITTEAWVLYEGAPSPGAEAAAQLRREPFTFDEPGPDEVLVEPIYGCWEGNMSHAVERLPVDICRQRREPKVVIGNAGVVRVLRPGADVRTLKEGDLCLVFCNGVSDARGYAEKIYAYDAPNTIGLLAKRTKLRERNLLRLPEGGRHQPQQWAAFSLRYITAWANWAVAYGSLRLQLPESACPAPHVWGWGGGVTLAELHLAQYAGCNAAMLASSDERLALIASAGIKAVDRRRFDGLYFEPGTCEAGGPRRAEYQEAEEAFLREVREQTGGEGVSIFIDFIGAPVFRATLKALARPGVITTAGWKEGMNLALVRAIECMKWHVHVHTHYARYDEAVEAVRFAEERGWMPEVGDEVFTWDEVPRLARAHVLDELSTYFPIYQVNQL